MDSLAYLGKPPAKPQAVYILHGDEDFLKRQCREVLVAKALGDGDASFALSNFVGDKNLAFSTIRNELDTLPFLSSVRVVVVEQADPFVTEHRPALEKYVAAPSKIGVLVLEVKAFPETTKLAKALPDAAKLACKAPAGHKLAEWCIGRSANHHGKRLTADGAGLLVDLVGSQMGLLDQELGKLAVAVGAKPTIDAPDVDQFVGRSRAANVFQILSAIGEGQPARALGILSNLFEEGEDPLAVLGPLTSQLRKLATVNRLVGQGLSLGQAMDGAKVPNWPQARQEAEKQVKHLGRRRLDALPEWLVEINLGLKGGNPLPPQLQVERLIVKLARPRGV